MGKNFSFQKKMSLSDSRSFKNKSSSFFSFNATSRNSPFIQPKSKKDNSNIRKVILGKATSFMPYEVQPGDTLTGIANKFKVEGGWKVIYKYKFNEDRISSPNVLYPGQWIGIPHQKIGDTEKMNSYSVGRKFNWDNILNDKRERKWKLDSSDKKIKEPHKRRVEISVDPKPKTIISIPVNTPRPKPTAEDIVSAKLKEGDEDMLTSLWASSGSLSKELTIEDLKNLPVSVLFPNETPPTEVVNRRQAEITLKIYLKNFSDKTRKELVEEYSTQLNDKITGAKGSNPEQKLFFKFDSTEFSPVLTSPKKLRNVIGQVSNYVSNFELYKSAQRPVITLEGYSSPRGPEKHNKNLSLERAKKVKKVLSEALKKRGLLSKVKIEAYGRGEDNEDILIVY